ETTPHPTFKLENYISIGNSPKLFIVLAALLDLPWTKPSLCSASISLNAEYDTKYLYCEQVLPLVTSHGLYILCWLLPLRGESENWLRSKVHQCNSRRRLLLLVFCSVYFRSQKSEMLKISENSPKNN
uniref:Uncharacterized protein n=1 Tax=Catharus ustulatus TaxID=91951 RepID=A0A8C3TNC4_CATUS